MPAEFQNGIYRGYVTVQAVQADNGERSQK